jgi:hypothetical protein
MHTTDYISRKTLDAITWTEIFLTELAQPANTSGCAVDGVSCAMLSCVVTDRPCDEQTPLAQRILRNVEKGSKIWQKNYLERLQVVCKLAVVGFE